VCVVVQMERSVMGNKVVDIQTETSASMVSTPWKTDNALEHEHDS
jgi:hypothetical protein